MAAIRNVQLSIDDTPNPDLFVVSVTYDLEISAHDAERFSAYREELDVLGEDGRTLHVIEDRVSPTTFRPVAGTQRRRMQTTMTRRSLAEDPDPPNVPFLPPLPKNLDEIRARVRLVPQVTPHLEALSQRVQRHFG